MSSTVSPLRVASSPDSRATHSGSAWGLIWALSLWLATVGNWPLWARLLTGDQTLLQRGGLALGLGLMVVGGTAALLWLVHWPRLYRPIASVLVLVTAFNSYFMWQYRAVIDSTMLANVMHTDAREVRDLMTWQLAASVVLIAGPAMWWIWRRPFETRPVLTHLWRNGVGAALGLGLVVGSALAGYQGLSSLMRNERDVRFMISPLNSVYAAGILVAEQMPRHVQALQPTGEDARLGGSYAAQARGPLLMVVVGETARAQNWQLNGYARPTTPRLAQWEAQDGLFPPGHLLRHQHPGVGALHVLAADAR